MSQNPYGQFGSPGPQQFAGGGDFVDPTPSRTSILAIIGLVISIVGCIACILPGPGAFAATLGGLAIFFIARSSGRLTGTGIAITAIVLGLFQSVAWIAVATGLSQANAQFGKQFFAPVGQMMAAIDKGDMKGARALFTKDSNAAITDDMLRDFAQRYRAQSGAFVRTPENVWETMTMAVELGKSAKKQGNRRGPIIQPHGSEPQIPIPARFAQGPAFVMMVVDPRQSGQHSGVPDLANVGVVTLDGTEIWLLDPAIVDKVLRSTSGTGTNADKPEPAKSEPAEPGSSPPDSPLPDAPKPGS